MTSREVVLGFLNKISPEAATNADIVSHTGIKPHQQVFQITQSLMKDGHVKGRRTGRKWYFSAENQQVASPGQQHPKKNQKKRAATSGTLSPAAFEGLCQKVMSKRLDIVLRPARLEGVLKKFDLVSADETIVGDAKYYTAVNGTSLPPAKFATIAEYVWLLEKTRAEKKFLVFGNDRRVPEWWLERYGNLLENVQFYFLTDEGKLDLIN